jgi:aromatic-amino-acid transaminase
LLTNLAPVPPDAIMRAARVFAEDRRPHKINLGIGIYYDEQGRIPLLKAVRNADRHLRELNRPWSYLPAEGLSGLRESALGIVFGEQASRIRERAVATQTVGGTGAVRLGAEIIKALVPKIKVFVSDPSWPNHQAVFLSVGLDVGSYRYHDAVDGSLDIDGMIEDLEAIPRGSVVVLHACCHNPTGVDPSPEEWGRIAETLNRRGLIPFLDMAYQGFGEGLEPDAASVRLIATACTPAFVAVSFSKSFSLYGERVGLLFVLAENEKQANLLDERARAITRVLHSCSPSNGALLVAEVLSTEDLKTEWIRELEEMRLRILSMRSALVSRLSDGNDHRDFSFIESQRGLFSYSRLSPSQIEALRAEHAIHAVEDGRLCLAALNTENLDRIVAAIRHVTMAGG